MAEQHNAAPPPWADLAAYRAAFRRARPIPGTADIAPGLAERRQWLLWRYEPGETPGKKPRKMPYYASGKRRDNPQGSDPDRCALVTAAEAIQAAGRGDYDGLGFAFLPGDGLIGIDLDGMIDPDSGEMSERCEGIIAACASYTEWSPSGKGVHIICAGETETFKSNKIGVEVFCGSQFFTFTGAWWTDSPFEVRPIAEPVLRRLRVTVKGKREPAPPPADASASPAPAQQPIGGKVRSKAETTALAEEALQHPGFHPDTAYQQWIEVGMALKSLGAVGYMLWDAWSARGEKYAGPDDTAKRWAGFNPTKITLGTLFGLAEAAGWESPWAKAKARKGRKAKAADASAPAPASSAEVPPPAPAAPPPPDEPPPTFDAPAGGGGEPPDDEWQLDLLRKKGEISPCLANAELILARMDEWRGAIGYDEFAEKTVFRRPLPCDRRGAEQGEWSDHLDATAAIWLQRKWGVEFSPTTVGQAVEVLARQHRFHPVREALEALPAWDGARRNAHWLSDYLGVKQTEYAALVGQFFLRGMIKRVMEPGSKFDYCLVLEGEQGKGKSTVAAILSWHWFCDTDLDLSSKDSLLALPGHWVYEIAELGSLMKAEERKQKSFLSRQFDEYRPPYGTRMIKVPRQCVFIGTTNEDEYLKDATGARRFWPVMCGDEINHDGLRANLEQMLAEALADYRAAERCWPTREEEDRLFKPEQVKRGMPEPFEDILYGWVDKQSVPFSMAEVAMDGLGLSADKLTPAVVTRIGMTLRKLGCVRDEDRLAKDPSRRRLYLSPKMVKAGMLVAKGDHAPSVPTTSGGLNAPF